MLFYWGRRLTWPNENGSVGWRVQMSIVPSIVLAVIIAEFSMGTSGGASSIKAKP
ncbi:hypothetical protein SLEP1_g34203 [Rubroshorea leprosula]|uniref:Uncharacterized protein n=1 Tax=Rubroshorea leprosula TaxID=152421 RepID=A0AAV5KJ33_9ROSI|nr:hypothetical protein SLEP1_g34203 [Rubroshorea leprosula]